MYCYKKLKDAHGKRWIWKKTCDQVHPIDAKKGLITACKELVMKKKPCGHMEKMQCGMDVKFYE